MLDGCNNNVRAPGDLHVHFVRENRLLLLLHWKFVQKVSIATCYCTCYNNKILRKDSEQNISRKHVYVASDGTFTCMYCAKPVILTACAATPELYKSNVRTTATATWQHKLPCQHPACFHSTCQTADAAKSVCHPSLCFVGSILYPAFSKSLHWS